MFNHSDYRMAKAQQGRLLAEAEKQGGRTRRPNRIIALVRRLMARRQKKADVKPSHRSAKAKV